jgi:molecular chaperone DnaK (HSP70)
VALGAGVLASRLGGHAVERVLVDVSPFSFGPSYLGIRDGYEYLHCYHPLIRRNTPLPVTRTEEYFTASDYQTAVEIDIYQGDDPDAMRNVHVGHFRIEGLAPLSGPNPVLCRMRLDLDGILHVTAIEKKTGLSKHVAITGATRRRDATELARGREDLDRLFARRVREDAEAVIEGVPPVEEAHLDPFGSLEGEEAVGEATDEIDETDKVDTGGSPESGAPDADVAESGQPSFARSAADAAAMVARCRQHMAAMHPDDQEEAVGLIEEVESAVAAGDAGALAEAAKALSEFLFFVEGR